MAGDQLVTEVTRTTVKPIARFKVRNPSLPEGRHDDTAFGPSTGEAAVF
ncbi:hypothetical protein FBZ33_2729 [Micromonospora sp. A202]|jgi:hypothetical protein|nr:hypothetical protein [Micromonospora sp. A202]TQJ22476.1 hypothetical protein FBZ33_2729 [Micromonospora sp. A202]